MPQVMNGSLTLLETEINYLCAQRKSSASTREKIVEIVQCAGLHVKLLIQNIFFYVDTFQSRPIISPTLRPGVSEAFKSAQITHSCGDMFTGCRTPPLQSCCRPKKWTFKTNIFGGLSSLSHFSHSQKADFCTPRQTPTLQVGLMLTSSLK